MQPRKNGKFAFKKSLHTTDHINDLKKHGFVVVRTKEQRDSVRFAIGKGTYKSKVIYDNNNEKCGYRIVLL